MRRPGGAAESTVYTKGETGTGYRVPGTGYRVRTGIGIGSGGSGIDGSER